MHEMKKKYLKILRIEIEDLQEDIYGLIRESEKEHDDGLVSEFVFLENLTVFKREILSLGVFFQILDSVDPERFENLDDMIEFIRISFNEKITECSLIKAINRYVERKVMKVKKYVVA